ncbi:MAG TPA: HNH endonuclease signature motif containing protein [Nocardioides sp.]|jgi:hypothetical protein|nr:HNH endonuclease signature motif containing protein [Nocardioides sp.]
MTVIATAPEAGLDELDPAGLLASLTDAETAERRASLTKLEIALQWCVLHPATADTGRAVWGDAALPGFTECDESLSGDGCPEVAAFAPEPFGAALGISTTAGMQLLADALDLAHRLPETWLRVQRLEVPAWRARRLAQATHHLPRAAAAQVDARLADRIGSCGVVAIDRAVAQVAALLDPGEQAEREELAREAWDVTLVNRTDGSWVGTSQLEATGDTGDLTRFYDLVCDHAAHLARLGDPGPLGARKARALGIIADEQTHLDLYGVPDATTAAAGGDERAELCRVRRPSLAKTRLHLHLTLADLVAGADGVVAVGEVEKLGPATTAKIRAWLGDSRATIVPVLDLGRDDAVDEHDPPEWMRQTVIVRDRHCVFPWCQTDARSCDVDHIDPYVDLDDGGPPGQTRPSNLAPLCRRHHRAKTSRRWRYRRHRDGTYTWHGPYAASYLVTPHGTTGLNDS